MRANEGGGRGDRKRGRERRRKREEYLQSEVLRLGPGVSIMANDGSVRGVASSNELVINVGLPRHVEKHQMIERKVRVRWCTTTTTAAATEEARRTSRQIPFLTESDTPLPIP